MTRVISTALALGCALAAAACAHSGPPRQGRGGPAGDAGGFVAQPIALVMSDFDADHDRTITRDELEAGAAAAWRELDENGDGDATPFELEAWQARALGSTEATPGRVTFDRNLDGRITEEEFLAALRNQFQRLDADGNAALARAELVRLVEPTFPGPRREDGDLRDARQRSPGGGGDFPTALAGPAAS